jgi:hypothetical protein
MLKSEKLLYKKYDEILVLSPSVQEFADLFLPAQNLCNSLDWDFVYAKIKYVNEKLADKYTNMLIIFDVRFL